MASYFQCDAYGDDEMLGWSTPKWIRALDPTDKSSALRQAGRDIDPTNPNSKYGNFTKGVLIAGTLMGGAALVGLASGGGAAVAKAVAGAAAPALLAGGAAVIKNKPPSRTDAGTQDLSASQLAGQKKKIPIAVPLLAGGAILTAALLLS